MATELPTPSGEGEIKPIEAAENVESAEDVPQVRPHQEVALELEKMVKNLMDTVNTFQTEINDKELAAKLDKLEQSTSERRGSENAAE